MVLQVSISANINNKLRTPVWSSTEIMPYKSRPTSLNKPVFRIFIAAVFALLFMQSAGAVVVITSADTMLIEFLGEYDEDLQERVNTGYYNDFLANEEDWDGNNDPPFEFDLLITGEYYTPTAPSPGDGDNFFPATWTRVWDPQPDVNLVGVYDGSTGMGLSSSVADEYNEVDGCQDEFCTGTLRWEALRFSFNRPVTLTEIGFSYAGSSDDFNLTVINGETETHPYVDVTPGDGFYSLSVSQTGTDFRIWADFEDDDFRITGIKISTTPVSIGDLAPRGAPDGVLDAADVLILTRLVSGQITPTLEEELRGDLNNNYVLDAGDLVLLQRAVLGLNPAP